MKQTTPEKITIIKVLQQPKCKLYLMNNFKVKSSIASKHIKFHIYDTQIESKLFYGLQNGKRVHMKN